MRIRRRNKAFSFLLILALLIAGAGFYFWTSQYKMLMPPGQDPAIGHLVPPPKSSSKTIEDGARPVEQPSQTDARVPAPAISSGSVAAEKDADVQGATTNADSRDEVEAAIDEAAQKALNTGVSVKWAASGASGYVVVSDSQNYPGKTCRNVVATNISGQEQKKSASHRWCRPAASDKWNLDDEG